MENKVNYRTFKIISLGCKVNYYEREYLSSLLKKNGYIEVPDDTKADISIINSCAVTEEASRKSRQMIRRTIKENPSELCIVMGCLSQIDPKIKDIPGVSIVLGTPKKAKVLDLIKEYEEKNEKRDFVNHEKYSIFKEDYDNYTVDRFEAHTRAFMKVEDGCNVFCTYCIIPYARGKVRSKPLESCIKEAKDLVNSGHKEIIISGIHTGAYGLDLGITMYDLLKELEKIDGLLRIRISSIEINQITDEIIDLVKNSKKIVHHFHIPIQSGSERILKLMNRHYTKEEFLSKVKLIRDNIEDVSLTTDYIVGFPTESDEDFAEVLDTLNKINFDMIHTFPFSKREGTPAAKMPQVDPKVKQERARLVRELSTKGYNDLVNRNIGKTVDVIFETYENGYIYGHSSTYIYIKAKGEISQLNKLLYVKILKNEKDAALAEITQ